MPFLSPLSMLRRYSFLSFLRLVLSERYNATLKDCLDKPYASTAVAQSHIDPFGIAVDAEVANDGTFDVQAVNPIKYPLQS